VLHIFYLPFMVQKWKRQGFTLLELLLVIAVLAILALTIILVINPGETLKKSRDAQRFSDLSTVKSAISFYITNTSTPYIGGSLGALSNTQCKSGGGGGSYASGDKIWYSVATTTPINDSTLDGGTGNIPASMQVVSTSATDGNGWIPVNFDSLTGASPISNIPVDPVNTFTNSTTISSADLVYRYACNSQSLTFEINTQLESEQFTVSDDKRRADGGNNDNLYEVGTNLKILGTGTDF
jgi:prepilin-type N-terminal cleavage/methylation domain-containing protein